MPLNDAEIRNLKTKTKAHGVYDFDGLFLLVKATGSKPGQPKCQLEWQEKPNTT